MRGVFHTFLVDLSFNLAKNKILPSSQVVNVGDFVAFSNFKIGSFPLSTWGKIQNQQGMRWGN